MTDCCRSSRDTPDSGELLLVLFHRDFVCCSQMVGWFPAFSSPYFSTDIRWSLQIKDMLVQGVLSFIERFPLFGG